MEPTELAQVTTTTVEAVAPLAHDMSFWGLFMSADFVVKAVIIGLLLASFWTWSIIFNKYMRLRALTKDADSFEESFWSGISLDALLAQFHKQGQDPMRAVFTSAMKEWQRAEGKLKEKAKGFSANLPERIERVMQTTLSKEMEGLERHLGFLATVGSTATFVGLFGTVWGIMNSFQAIAVSKNTSLAVVAPGIAEALFATAIGLIAAIPAMIAYNKISGEIARYGNRLDSFVAEFRAIITRHIEEA
jgi:biopolymer transport protein TolQ